MELTSENQVQVLSRPNHGSEVGIAKGAPSPIRAQSSITQGIVRPIAEQDSPLAVKRTKIAHPSSGSTVTELSDVSRDDDPSGNPLSKRRSDSHASDDLEIEVAPRISREQSAPETVLLVQGEGDVGPIGLRGMVHQMKRREHPELDGTVGDPIGMD